MLRDQNRCVIGRIYHEIMQGLVQGHFVAFFNADLLCLPFHVRNTRGSGQCLIQVPPVLKCQQGCHDLGDTGGINLFCDVIVDHRLSAFQVKQTGCLEGTDIHGLPFTGNSKVFRIKIRFAAEFRGDSGHGSRGKTAAAYVITVGRNIAAAASCH